MLLLVLIFESFRTLLAIELHVVEAVHFKSTKFGLCKLFQAVRTCLVCLCPLCDATPAVNVFALLALDWVFDDQVANSADERLV